MASFLFFHAVLFYIYQTTCPPLLGMWASLIFPKWAWSCSSGHPVSVTLRAQLEGHPGVQSLDPLGTFSPHLSLQGAGAKSQPPSHSRSPQHEVHLGHFISQALSKFRCPGLPRETPGFLCASDSYSQYGLTRCCLLFRTVKESNRQHYLKIYLPTFQRLATALPYPECDLFSFVP